MLSAYSIIYTLGLNYGECSISLQCQTPCCVSKKYYMSEFQRLLVYIVPVGMAIQFLHY